MPSLHEPGMQMRRILSQQNPKRGESPQIIIPNGKGPPTGLLERREGFARANSGRPFFVSKHEQPSLRHLGVQSGRQAGGAQPVERGYRVVGRDRAKGPMRLVLVVLVQAAAESRVQRGLGTGRRVLVELLPGLALLDDPGGEPRGQEFRHLGVLGREFEGRADIRRLHQFLEPGLQRGQIGQRRHRSRKGDFAARPDRVGQTLHLLEHTTQQTSLDVAVDLFE